MLTLLCFRSEETAAKPFLQALLERAGRDIWSAISLEPMTEDEAQTLIGALLPADSALTDRRQASHDARSGRQPIRARAAGPLRGRQHDRSRVTRPRLRRCSRRGSVRSRRRRAASSRRWRSAAGRWRPTSSATRAGSRASGSRSWRCSAPPVSFAAAARRSGSRPITIGFARCSPREIAPDAVRRIHGLHGAGARREAKRRLRGAVRALSRRRRLRERVDSGRSCRREGGRRARLRSGRVLLPARAGAGAGVVRRPRMEGRTRQRARQRRPAGRGRRSLPACGGGSRSTVERVELQRRGGRAVPDRRAHRSRAGPDSHHARGHGHGRAAKPARGAAVAVVATRTAAVARVALRVEGRRRNRCRYPPSRGHLLVGDDGIAAGGHDQRVGFQRASPAHGARCRGTVPSRARDGDRVGGPRPRIRAGRTFSEQLVQQSKALAKSVGQPARDRACPSWRTASWR